MAERNGFFLYLDQHAPIADLTLEQKGMLLDAMFAFNAGQPFVLADPVVRVAFGFFKASFQREQQKYSEICKRRKAAAKSRWDANEPNASDAMHAMQMHANASDAMQTMPKPEPEQEQEENTSPPVESLVNQDRACAREEPQGRGEALPFAEQDTSGQRAADPVDLSGPGMEFLELREFYSREIRPEGPLDGFAEYKQLKAARDSMGASVFPGLSRILDDLAARKAAGVWNPGYEISLARYLKTRTWLAPIQARASPQVKSWQEREDEANFNAAMAAARAYDEAKAREKGMVQEKTA